MEGDRNGEDICSMLELLFKFNMARVEVVGICAEMPSAGVEGTDDIDARTDKLPLLLVLLVLELP
jgi:hypothetical protein